MQGRGKGNMDFKMHCAPLRERPSLPCCRSGSYLTETAAESRTKHLGADIIKKNGRFLENPSWALEPRFLLSTILWAIMCQGVVLSWGQEMAGGKGSKEGRVYVNQDTGYQVFLEDEAKLLTKDQQMELSEVMKEITVYGNAGFVTTDGNPFSTENFARDYYRNRFGTESGTVFVIDMDHRNIWIHSDGAGGRSGGGGGHSF